MAPMKPTTAAIISPVDRITVAAPVKAGGGALGVVALLCAVTCGWPSGATETGGADAALVATGWPSLFTETGGAVAGALVAIG